jgi:hypothetical protein
MKKLYFKMRNWLREMINSPINRRDTARQIIELLNSVKGQLTSPASKIILHAIPGQIDSKIVAAVLKAINTLLPVLNAITPEVQNMIIAKAGALAFAEIHNETESDADMFLQFTYNKIKNLV